MNNILLLNFRVPIEVKNEFEQRCGELRTNMTAELNRMIREFLKSTSNSDREPLTWFSTSSDWRL
jgi:hypothetical protein